MRALILAAGAALTLSACGGGGTENQANEIDTLEVNNLVVDANAMDPMNMDANMANMTAEDHSNMVMNDMTTNTPDTNLANGL